MADELDTVEQLRRVREHVVPELDQADVDRLIAGASRKRERSRIRRSLAAGLALGAAIASALWLSVRSPWGAENPPAPVVAPQSVASVLPPPAMTQLAPPTASRIPRSWELSDDSKAMALLPATDLVIEQDSPERAMLKLERGRARFEVTHRPERTFTVLAGSVSVSVVGTVFDVEVVADRIGVVVLQGAVDVAWHVGQKRLAAGEQGWFPPLVVGAGDAALIGGQEAAPNPTSRIPESGPRAASRPGSSAQELLAESDAARTRGEPALGAELLRRVLRDHPGDARAPLAAFTLGRLLLNELGKPREAAAAFHEVQVRAPAGQFAEDALAREAEAWKQAAEPARAVAVARAYLSRYPSGRHLRRMQALVGRE